MADKKQRKPQYTTPAGEAVWPWINKYDDRDINGTPQKPAYKLGIKYSAINPAWMELKAKLDVLVEQAFQEMLVKFPQKKKVMKRAYPYSMLTDSDGEETGDVLLKLKQNAFITDKKTGEETLIFIPKFDAAGKPMDNSRLVYGGSIVKSTFTTRPYFVASSNNAGITMDMRAVQVLDLVSNQQRSAASYGFGKEEGYEGEDTEDDTEDSDNSEKAASGSDDATDPTDF